MALIATAVMLVLAPVLPAGAAAAPLEYSRDGVTWSTTAPAALFDSGFRIAPGGTESAGMWVRTTRSSPTSLTVLVSGASAPDPLYASALTIAGSDGSSGLPATAFSRVGSCTKLIPTRTLAQGESVAFSVTVALDPAVTGTQAQASSATFDIVFRLTDPGLPVPGDGCASSPALIPGTPVSPAPASVGPSVPATSGSFGLAYTGSTVPYALLVIVGIALGVGWILILAGRRRRREQE